MERFHGTFRPDFLDLAEPFTSIEEAQAAVDAWVGEYNADRPHQGLDEHQPVTPAERFTPIPAEQRELVQPWLPPTLTPAPAGGPEHSDGPERGPRRRRPRGPVGRWSSTRWSRRRGT